MADAKASAMFVREADIRTTPADAERGHPSHGEGLNLSCRYAAVLPFNKGRLIACGRDEGILRLTRGVRRYIFKIAPR